MDLDPTSQGSCEIEQVLVLAPRLKGLVNKLTHTLEADGRGLAGGGHTWGEKVTAAFFDSVGPSKVLVLNGNLNTVKRSVFLPDAPPLFNPEARPPPFTSEANSPVVRPPNSPRRIGPRVWFKAAGEGWVEEFHAHATASSQPLSEKQEGERRAPRLSWRPVTAEEKALFALCDFVVRRVWVCELPSEGGGARFPTIDNWDIDEFFMTKDQLMRLEARRQFAYMWRGEPAESKRLNKFREGAPAQPKMPPNDPAGDPLGLPAVLDRRGNGAESGLKTQLHFWQVDALSETLDLAAQDLDPCKVPALVSFISGHRNCQSVDVRSNPRLSVSDGTQLAKALLANFEATPNPVFMTRKPPLPPLLDTQDQDAVEKRVKQVADALTELRAARRQQGGLADAAQLGVALQRCFDLGIADNTDVECCMELFTNLLRKRGSRVPNRGSLLSFNALPVHCLRSGTAKSADVSNCSLGACDVTVLLELLVAPFSNEDVVPLLGSSTVLSVGQDPRSVSTREVRNANRVVTSSQVLNSTPSLLRVRGEEEKTHHAAAASSSLDGGASSSASASSSSSSSSLLSVATAPAHPPSAPLPSFKPLAPSLFIEELVLTGNEGVGDGGAESLSAAIRAHCFPVLSVLGLSGIGLGPLGFELLAKALRRHGDTLTSLDLSMNRGGPHGLRCLVEQFLFSRNTEPLYATAADACGVGESNLTVAEQQQQQQHQQQAAAAAAQRSKEQGHRDWHQRQGGEGGGGCGGRPGSSMRFGEAGSESASSTTTTSSSRKSQRNLFNQKAFNVGWSRSLKLKTLKLVGNVGSLSNFGDDLSGVETLAACLVHPDAACSELDLLYLGGAALPVLHLKGCAVELSRPEATRAATTFMQGKVEVPFDAFAEKAQQDSKVGADLLNKTAKGRGEGGEADNGKSADGEFDDADNEAGLGGAREEAQRQKRKNKKKKRQQQQQQQQREEGTAALAAAAKGSGFVKRSEVRDRLAARLKQGPMLRGSGYPDTNHIAGTARGCALTEIDLSCQGCLLSVEDCVVVAALVEENATLQSLRVNSHRPLPVKALRGDEGHVVEILDFSNCYWFAQEVLVAARLLRHNRRVRTIRLCDNQPCVVAGSGTASAYPKSGLGDLTLTLTPPMRGLHGPQLTVVGRRPPRSHARRRQAENLAHLLGTLGDDVLREGRPPLFDPTNWFTSCRPDFVDLSNCGITSSSHRVDTQNPPHPRALCALDPTPQQLLEPVLRGLYTWGLEHAVRPDSLVLIRKDLMPVVDASIRRGEQVPERLSSPYSPYRKARAKRGGAKHLNSISAEQDCN